jgi:hypothetical protein
LQRQYPLFPGSGDAGSQGKQRKREKPQKMSIRIPQRVGEYEELALESIQLSIFLLRPDVSLRPVPVLVPRDHLFQIRINE